MKRENLLIERKNQRKNGFVLFLAAMAGMTVLSRFGDSLMVPQVEVGTFEEMALEEPVEIAGRVGTKEKQVLYCKENLRIGQVLVQKNDVVQKGEPLFTIDLQDLSVKMKETEKEIRKCELQIADLENAYREQVNQQKQSLNRAEEDYKAAADATDHQVNQAYAEMEKARAELEQYNSRKPGKDLEKKGEELEQKREEEQQHEEERKYEEEQKGEELAQRYEEKQKLYADAVTAREEALKLAARQVEDAGREIARDNSAALLQMEKENLEHILEGLRELQQKEGRVCAEFDGRILECAMSPGNLTTQEPVMILENFSQPLQFEGVTAENEKVSVEEGTICRLEMENGDTILEEIKISKVTEEEDGSCRVTAELDSDLVSRTGNAVLSFTKESKRYQYCIPLSALYQEASGYYVIGVKESNTILGTQWTAQYVPVTLEESNEGYAAVSGNLSGYDKIVFHASKKKAKA